MSEKNQAFYPCERLDPAKLTGLVLCGMGGPDGPEAVKPFLRNLFADPSILPVPRLISPLLGWLVSTRRAPGARERYRQVSPDCVTPQLGTTLAQAEALALRLSEKGIPCIGGMAMRYWHPYPDQTLKELVQRGAEQFILVPTYPQYSCATTGSTLKFALDALPETAPGLPVHVMHEWPLLPGLVATMSRAATEAVQGFASQGFDPSDCALIYVAHSLPQKMVDQGDPYLDQTLSTVQAIQENVQSGLAGSEHSQWAEQVVGMDEPILTFQSRVGPIQWLGPEVTKAVQGLADRGCRHLHVQPVSFTCEHVETVLELDVELKEDAEKAGIQTFSRGAALNLDPVWLESLSEELQRRAFKMEEFAK
jgi:protoporphyrin/coproporphyrin ferrochelatase